MSSGYLGVWQRGMSAASSSASAAVSDRAAYVSFLETQLERVTARESALDDVCSRSAAAERAVAAQAAYCERQGAEAALRAAGAHRADGRGHPQK